MHWATPYTGPHHTQGHTMEGDTPYMRARCTRGMPYMGPHRHTQGHAIHGLIPENEYELL